MVFLTVLANGFILGLSGAMMPGPLLTQTINRSARGGLMMAPLIILGHGILEFAIVVGLIFGFSRILTNKTVSGFIGIAGGLVLIWMGYDIIKNVRQGKLALNKEISEITEEGVKSNFLDGKAGTVLTGLVVSSANPYFLIWWATVGLALFNDSRMRLGYGGPFVFYTGHISSDLLWFALVGFAVVKGRKVIPEKVYQGLLIFCGLFLIGYAVKLIVYGAGMLS